MPGIEQTWDALSFTIKLGDKIADTANALDYAALLPDLVRAAVGIGEVPEELLDIDHAEMKDLYTRGDALADDLKLGSDIIHDDVEDGMEIAYLVKQIVLRHIEAKKQAAEQDSTKAGEPTP